MIQQIDYEKWLDRIDTTLAIQKDMCCETIRQNYTRRELIELRLMVSSLYEEQRKEKKTNDD